MSASQPAYFHLQEFSDGGVLLVGGRLYTYAQGTTALKVAYTDPAGAVAQTYTADGQGGQYIALNARGELPATLYLATGAYDIALKRADGSTVWTRRADPTGDGAAVLAGPAGAGAVGWIQSGIGAITRWVLDKLRDYRKSVMDYGAVGDGATNVTASFTKARTASGGGYHIPNGTYVLDAVPDVFADNFTAGDNVTLIVGGFAYNVSNALSGGLRWNRASNVKLDLLDAKTGNTVLYMQNGAPGTASIGVYRGMASTTDSHFFQAQPATNGGSTDLLFQRSTLNPDPAGNRFNVTFEEASDRLVVNFATTAAGFPNFDSAMQIYGGIAPQLKFPGIRADFQQGVDITYRSGATFGYRIAPISTSVHAITDSIGGGTLATVNASGFTFNTAATAWQNGAFPTGNLTFITGGVAVAVLGANALALYQNGAEAWRVDTSKNFIPGLDNVYSLGSAAKRASVIYSGTGAINTSDERAKTPAEAIPQPWLDAWGEVEFVRFKYLDAVAAKADRARWHVGVIAQRVKEAFERHGVDPFAVGILCWDKWDDQYSETMQKVMRTESRMVVHSELVPRTRTSTSWDGEQVVEHYNEDVVTEVEQEVEIESTELTRLLSKPAGEQYGIRYEEAIALECAYLRSRIAALGV
jgi:hypothetical protein